MQRVALRAVVDLVAAGGAVGDDERVGVGLAHRGQQRELAHRHRDVDRVGAVAERAGHAAAARLHGLDLQVRDQLEDALDRAHHAERLLVAMAVHQRALRDRLERQLEPPERGLAHEKFLEHQRVHRELLRAVGLDHRGDFVAEAQDAARLEPDHVDAARDIRRDRRDHALGLAPRLDRPCRPTGRCGRSRAGASNCPRAWRYAPCSRPPAAPSRRRRDSRARNSG